MRKLLLDTDLGSDCDDVGACALALHAHRAGDIRLLALTHCIGNHYGARFIRLMCDYAQIDIPVGVLYDDTFMNGEEYERYAKPYCDAYPESRTYVFEDAVRLLRRTLADNGGLRDITLATIGPLRNIHRLLLSPPDDLSPLTGDELVRENVREGVFMLGGFEHPERPEYNVVMDIPAAKYVIEHFPAPIVYSGYEVGKHLMTGAEFAGLPEDHPCRAGYTLHMQKNHRPQLARESWDPVTVAYAAYGTDAYFTLSDLVTVRVLENGAFEVNPGGTSRYLIQAAPDDTLTAWLDRLMRI